MRWGNNTQSLRNLLGGYVQQHKHRNKLFEKRIASAWCDLMGQSIADMTTRIKLRDKTLFMDIESGPLKQELHFEKEKIIQRLNERIGYQLIEKVVIR